MRTLNPGLINLPTDSGVAATRFSRGNVSFGTPIVNLLYSIPFGFSSVAAPEAEKVRLQVWENCIRYRALDPRVDLVSDRRIIVFENAFLYVKFVLHFQIVYCRIPEKVYIADPITDDAVDITERWVILRYER